MRISTALGALTLALMVAGCGSSGGDGPDTTTATDTGPDEDAAADTGAADTAQPVDTTPPAPPEWQHEGPIVPGAAKAPVAPLFVNVAAEVGLDAMDLGGPGRAMVVDFDGDGRDDLVVLPATVTAPATMSPKFLRNAGKDGAGQVRFEDVTAASGMAEAEATVMVFADIDNDGDEDVFTGVGFRAANGEVAVWLNDGHGVFTSAGSGGLASPVLGQSQGNTIYKEISAASFADLDGDGLLDLYYGTWYSGSPTTDGQYPPPLDELYKGDGHGGWTAVTLPAQTNPLTVELEPALAGTGRPTYGIAMADFDGDGDMDIFVNNYGAGRPALGSPPSLWEWNFLWRNDGGMQFTDVGVAAGVAATRRGIGGVEKEEAVVMDGKTYPGPIGGNGFGCQWGDLDNDGDMDLVVGTIAHPDYPQSDRTMLHYNQGGPDWKFTEESKARGLQYYEDELHPALIDVDNDGRLDFAISRLRGGSKWELYLQQASQKFRMLSYAETGVDITRPNGTVWLDYDGDGDLDFFMPLGKSVLMENRVGQDNGWLELRLVATAPRDATGARVTIETSVGEQVREVTSGNGHYNTQLSRHLLFGLGGDSGAGNVTIRWPNGEVQALGDVKAGRRLRVTQGGEITAY